ncbi:MAG: CRISPR-associated endonuclease Cas2 [Pyrinomonadaceae bacterium]|nr:CRISPR-associated endonuclease Cas2 [Pyrinomonadaceae bacterium]
MADKNWYVISYDITDQKRWKKVYRRLNGYGRRLQYSIFRCRLTKIEVEKLRWELEKDMSIDDKLLILNICERCENKTVSLNRPESWTQENKTFDFA